MPYNPMSISFIGLYALLTYFEFHRNSVVEPSNLEALGIPILATLPSVPIIKKGYHLSQIFMEDVNSEFSELIIFLSVAILGLGKLFFVISFNIFEVSIPEILITAIPDIPGPDERA